MYKDAWAGGNPTLMNTEHSKSGANYSLHQRPTLGLLPGRVEDSPANGGSAEGAADPH